MSIDSYVVAEWDPINCSNIPCNAAMLQRETVLYWMKNEIKTRVTHDRVAIECASVSNLSLSHMTAFYGHVALGLYSSAPRPSSSSSGMRNANYELLLQGH